MRIFYVLSFYKRRNMHHTTERLAWDIDAIESLSLSFELACT